MANYSDLKTAIDVYIRNNGNGEITGDILNQVLKNMVNVLGGGYQFAGAATTGMNPGTPDNNVYYVTTTAGTYTNFGGLVVYDGELALLTYNGVWQKVAVTLPAGGGGAAVEVVDNLDSESTTAALSANQGRVLKNIIDSSPGINQKVYIVYIDETLEDWQIAANAEAVAAVIADEKALYLINNAEWGMTVTALIALSLNGFASFAVIAAFSNSDGVTLTSGSFMVKADGTLYTEQSAEDLLLRDTKIAELLAAKQDSLVSGTNIKTINGISLLGSGNIPIEGGGSGGGLETRILYVPEMTAAGSELTAEEKAYNVEAVSKMLAGTARAAIAIPGIINLTTTNALNLAAAEYEGTLVVFESEFVTPFDTGFVIGTDGDILLNFPASSTIVIPDVEAVDFDALSVAISYRSLANNLPVIYFAYEDSYYLFQNIVIVGNSYILDSDYTYGSYYYHARLMMLAGESIFERRQIPREVYIVNNNSSEMQANIDWITGYSFISSDTRPFVVYNNYLKYAPLQISVEPNTHADFTIYRNGAFEVWRILASDGSASLIETIPISGGGTE